ncbi:MAG: alpha/beta hydrolase [Pseudomonadales bacterium]|nr:alpha/beta hydrolase [Pseudomonadales bacterium]
MSEAIEHTGIRIGPWTFDVAVSGTPGRPLVLLLHGFPQTSHTWRDLLPALADAGYQAAAPNQRGYSPGARPLAVVDYATGLLVDDALGIADAFGAERFHLVGHDWGGHLAWLIAARHPDRVRTLTVLSRPHPAAFAAAMRADPAQSDRSRHHRAFQDPDSARQLLADGARRLRASFASQGVPDTAIDAYLERLGTEAALDAALNWYRAATLAGPGARDVPAVTVPTLYLWGSADATVGRVAAEGTAERVTGPYVFEVIDGAGHFLTDDAGPRVISALRAFLARWEHVR